jgi:lysocardiolipin and lysophospholipid acyltransferase
MGMPLYLINREWYYAWMAMTKKYFCLVITVMTQIWGPTTVRISGDATVAGQIRPTASGGVEFDFPQRLVLVANHQVSTPEFDLPSMKRTDEPRFIPIGCTSGGLDT